MQSRSPRKPIAEKLNDPAASHCYTHANATNTEKRIANFTDAIGIFEYPDVARIAKVVHNRFIVHTRFLLYLYVSITPGLSGIPKNILLNFHSCDREAAKQKTIKKLIICKTGLNQFLVLWHPEFLLSAIALSCFSTIAFMDPQSPWKCYYNL